MDPQEPLRDDDAAPAWPDRLVDLGVRLRSEASRLRSDVLIGEIWLLLNLALRSYVRKQGHRLGPLSVDDAADIASEKASELVRRLDSKDWNLADLSPAQVCGFLAAVARNGVVDLHRIRRREVSTPADFDVPFSRRAWGGAGEREESAASGVDGAAYAEAIFDCAAGLSARARRAWYLRVLYEIGSADIARDPAVASSPAGVDAMLARCREQMRSCLARKGFTVGPLPPGTFTRLWEMTRGDAVFASPPPVKAP